MVTVVCSVSIILLGRPLKNYAFRTTLHTEFLNLPFLFRELCDSVVFFGEKCRLEPNKAIEHLSGFRDFFQATHLTDSI